MFWLFKPILSASYSSSLPSHYIKELVYLSYIYTQLSLLHIHHIFAYQSCSVSISSSSAFWYFCFFKLFISKNICMHTQTQTLFSFLVNFNLVHVSCVNFNVFFVKFEQECIKFLAFLLFSWFLLWLCWKLVFYRVDHWKIDSFVVNCWTLILHFWFYHDHVIKFAPFFNFFLCI